MSHLDAIRRRLSAEREAIRAKLNRAPDLADGEPIENANGDGFSQSLNRDLEFAERERLLVKARELERALERIEAGEYGCCESCERAIGAKRLRALPTAALCIRCATEQEARGRSALRTRGYLDESENEPLDVAAVERDA